MAARPRVPPSPSAASGGQVRRRWGRLRQGRPQQARRPARSERSDAGRLSARQARGVITPPIATAALGRSNSTPQQQKQFRRHPPPAPLVALLALLTVAIGCPLLGGCVVVAPWPASVLPASCVSQVHAKRARQSHLQQQGMRFARRPPTRSARLNAHRGGGGLLHFRVLGGTVGGLLHGLLGREHAHHLCGRACQAPNAQRQSFFSLQACVQGSDASEMAARLDAEHGHAPIQAASVLLYSRPLHPPRTTRRRCCAAHPTRLVAHDRGQQPVLRRRRRRSGGRGVLRQRCLVVRRCMHHQDHLRTNARTRRGEAPCKSLRKLACYARSCEHKHPRGLWGPAWARAGQQDPAIRPNRHTPHAAHLVLAALRHQRRLLRRRSRRCIGTLFLLRIFGNAGEGGAACSVRR